MSASHSLWGGRFSEGVDQFIQHFTASIDFDKRLAAVDIQGSLAHAAMLCRQNIISATDLAAIEMGLKQIQKEIENGELSWSVALEDVHMNIEKRLTEVIGEAGKRLHTARSRNDQVATDIRLYTRAAMQGILSQIHDLKQALLDVAEREYATIMPGFTHLQTAQPITFGHHLMAYYAMLRRDGLRFEDALKRLNECPLGAGALAGSPFPLDRHQTAEALHFDAPCANSLDAVSDRDFAIECCAAASILMMHLSRFAEELILWNSQMFAFVQLPDRFCTGSSMMPQKKNPDVPELIRGKTGRVYGDLMALLTLMKAQPLAYNKDNQEDKEPLFDTLDTVSACLQAMNAMVPHLQAQRDNMKRAAQQGYANATDFADYLVMHCAVPFRDAHEIVGRAVALAIQQNQGLEALSDADFKALHPQLEGENIRAFLQLEAVIARRNHFGGTAPTQVLASIQQARQEMSKRQENEAASVLQ